MEVTYSIHRVPIRLTEERWQHIVANKPYMEPLYDAILEAVAGPEIILRGYQGSQVAVVSLAKQRYLHVVYREVSKTDGFIITAFISRKVNRRAITWKQSS